MAELDALISGAAALDAKFLETLLTLSATLVDNIEPCKLYISTATKIVAKGVDYVEKEISRLSSMIANPNVKPEAATGFQLRQNILRAFQK